ncbi:tetratricopeptide repeat-containing diguanylate cyclase [Simiduia aestuariiviva]|uniref:diguanylate cyclase n=1 Tax=Simiduia aestuariiviva TaxID=1510459 RepID=A0A839USZ4_9GAMM|nr:diguanylate cyclase [Simiduia aestuariiviva]MBB3169539.1 diguanylate cyclase (GGDEF)-like protein [Simiduia aestuariiviva]
MTPRPTARPRTAGHRIAIGFALLLSLLSGAAAASGDVELSVDAAFRQLEDAELVGSYEDYRRAFKALGERLDANDAAQQERYRRLGCWMQPEQSLDQINTAIDNATQWINRAMARDDRLGQADYLLCRGWFEEIAGNYKPALRDYEAALAVAEGAEDRRLIADALSARGELLALQGDLAQALSDLQVAHQMYHLIGNRYWTAYTLSMVANTYRRMGDFDRAKELLQEVIEIYAKRDDKESADSTRFMLALTYDDLGEYDAAYAIYRDMLAQESQQGLERAKLGTYIAIADNRLRAGDVAAATEALDRAEPLLDPSLDALNLALWKLFKANQLVAVGDHTSALQLLIEAEPVVAEQDQHRYLAWIQKLKAEVLGQLGRWQTAYQALSEYQRTHEMLLEKLRDQTSTRMRIEFDAARKDAENRALKSERDVRQAKLQYLEERKRWQGLLLACSVVILFTLALLAVRQWRRSHRLRHLAMTDELTGLPNRRSIYQSGKETLAQCRAEGDDFSLLVFDVDYFKRINDTWGHEIGDRVLQKISDAAASCLRKHDVLGRTGGEEFLVTLPSADLESASDVAQRLCETIADIDLRDVADNLSVSVSVGVAQCQKGDSDFSHLINRADNALYRAKDRGRNCVALDPEST